MQDTIRDFRAVDDRCRNERQTLVLLLLHHRMLRIEQRRLRHEAEYLFGQLFLKCEELTDARTKQPKNATNAYRASASA